MNIITLDFETFYSKDYTLSKLTTEAYVRDARFKTHGCGIRWPDGTCEWVPHADLPAVFATIDWANTAVLAHHAQFDGLILSHHYGRHPALWLDTLSMAHMRALPGALAKLAEYYRLKPKGDALVQTLGMWDLSAETERALAEYCLHDVELTWDIFRRLSAGFPPQELKVIDLTMRMFTRPLLRINTEALHAYQASERERKATLLQSAGVDAALLRSTQQFRAWLASRGIDPLPPTCAKTDKAMQALLDYPDEQVAAAVAARLGVASSIGETRAQRMIDMAERGLACVYLKYWGAHTGRWSGGDKLNFQNLRKGTALRTALRAPRGHQVVVMDSSQIEVRVLAWLAGQRDVLDNFAAGRDVYREFGAVVYGVPPDQIDKTQRFVSKTCVLGLGFGTGHAKLRQTLAQGTTGPVVEVSEAEAQRLVAVYRTQHAHVVALWRDADRLIRAMVKGVPLSIAGDRVTVLGHGMLQTLPGIRLYYPGLRLEADGFVYGHGRDETKLYGAKLVENIVQHYARMVIAEQMVEIGKRWPIVTTTHDEIVCIAPDDKVQACHDDMQRVMSTPPAWAQGIVLAAEGGFAEEYSK